MTGYIRSVFPPTAGLGRRFLCIQSSGRCAIFTFARALGNGKFPEFQPMMNCVLSLLCPLENDWSKGQNTSICNIWSKVNSSQWLIWLPMKTTSMFLRRTLIMYSGTASTRYPIQPVSMKHNQQVEGRRSWISRPSTLIRHSRRASV
jgi:hypothetical protein